MTMDVKELLKLQLMSSLGIGLMHGMNQSPAAHGSSNMVHLFNHMVAVLLMSVLDDVLKTVPRFFGNLNTALCEYWRARVKRGIGNVVTVRPPPLADVAITLSTRHFVNSLEMTRTYQTAEGGGTTSSAASAAEQSCEESNGMVDAVLAQVSKLDNVPSFSLIRGGQIMVNYKDQPIQLTRDIFLRILSVTMCPGGVSIASVKISLQSNTLSAAEITEYVRNLYANYLQELKNSLGNNIYFFDHKSKDAPPPMAPPGATEAEAIANHKRMMISTAPKQLSFTKTPFYSNKSFGNIYGAEARLIEQRLRFFIDNKQWYDRKGIPYQLGMLLSGIAGAGKTSVIRAVANLTKRHIVNVNFANITTATQLKNLFYNDRLQVYTDQNMSATQSYFIPVDQRLYVLEEIDAIGDIVKQRTPEEADALSKSAVNDELTLAEILTVLDGTMEVPGRIVIMTTNHPEVLDRALIRPGRIDVQVNFTHASRSLIAEMYGGYMDRPFPEERVHELPDRVLSPAEVGQVLFRHFDVRCGCEAAAVDVVQRKLDTIIEDLSETAAKKMSPSRRRADEKKNVAKDEPVLSRHDVCAVIEADARKQVIRQIDGFFSTGKSSAAADIDSRPMFDDWCGVDDGCNPWGNGFAQLQS